jgi:hypothetical protein
MPMFPFVRIRQVLRGCIWDLIASPVALYHRKHHESRNVTGQMSALVTGLSNMVVREAQSLVNGSTVEA